MWEDLVFFEDVFLFKKLRKQWKQDFLVREKDFFFSEDLESLDKKKGKTKVLYTGKIEDLKNASQKRKVDLIILKLDEILLDKQVFQLLRGKKIELGFFFLGLFEGKKTAKKIRNLLKVAELSRRFFIRLKVFSGARKKEDLRKLSDLCLLLREVGFDREQIKGFYGERI